jgi:hypothetical protein
VKRFGVEEARVLKVRQVDERYAADEDVKANQDGEYQWFFSALGDYPPSPVRVHQTESDHLSRESNRWDRRNLQWQRPKPHCLIEFRFYKFKLIERISIWCKYHEMIEPPEKTGRAGRLIISPECSHKGHLYSILVASRCLRGSIGAPFHHVPPRSSPAGSRFGVADKACWVRATEYLNGASYHYSAATSRPTKASKRHLCFTPKHSFQN